MLRRHTPRTIDWMHPSWRDLVIDRLVAHEPARHAFLQRCGVAGFLLALSNAGGAEGRRERPLLRTDRDWQSLSKAVPRVLGDDLGAASQVLASLQNALLASTEERPAAGSTNPALTKLTIAVLAFLRHSWSSGNALPSAYVLNLYYSVSELVAPLPPGPDLRLLWRKTWSAACAEITVFDPSEVEFELNELLEWAKVMSSIAANEPRFLGQICFPYFHSEISNSLISGLKDRVEMRFDLDYESDCSEEEDRMDTIAAIAGKIADRCPDQASEARVVAKLAKANSLRAETLRREMEEEANEEERERNRGQSTSYKKAALSNGEPPEEPINLTELFSDL